MPYYLAREEGALRAVRFMANAADPSRRRRRKDGQRSSERGGMQRYAYANAVVYSAPADGNIVNGSVYADYTRNRWTRLRQGRGNLRHGGTERRYEGLQDLVDTLNAIVESERVAVQA